MLLRRFYVWSLWT